MTPCDPIEDDETVTEILCGILAGIAFGGALMAWVILSFFLGAAVHL